MKSRKTYLFVCICLQVIQANGVKTIQQGRTTESVCCVVKMALFYFVSFFINFFRFGNECIFSIEVVAEWMCRQCSV